MPAILGACKTGSAGEVDQLSVELSHGAELTVAQMYGTLGNHIEHRLNVGV